MFGEISSEPKIFGDLTIPKAYLNEAHYLTEEGDLFLGLEGVVKEWGGLGLVENYGVACESKPNTYGHFGGPDTGYCRTIDVFQKFDGSAFSAEPSIIGIDHLE